MSGTLQSASLRHEAGLMYRRAVLIEKSEFLWKAMGTASSPEMLDCLKEEREQVLAELRQLEDVLPNVARTA